MQLAKSVRYSLSLDTIGSGKDEILDIEREIDIVNKDTELFVTDIHVIRTGNDSRKMFFCQDIRQHAVELHDAIENTGKDTGQENLRIVVELRQLVEVNRAEAFAEIDKHADLHECGIAERTHGEKNVVHDKLILRIDIEIKIRMCVLNLIVFNLIGDCLIELIQSGARRERGRNECGEKCDFQNVKEPRIVSAKLVKVFEKTKNFVKHFHCFY